MAPAERYSMKAVIRPGGHKRTDTGEEREAGQDYSTRGDSFRTHPYSAARVPGLSLSASCRALA
jgi:hypothetical protein